MLAFSDFAISVAYVVNERAVAGTPLCDLQVAQDYYKLTNGWVKLREDD
jgi:hypothetical protein